MEKGFCVLSNGEDQNSGVVKINNVDGNTKEAQAICLAKCKQHEAATGCEVIWDQGNRGCYVHTQSIARGNAVERHQCWVFSKCSKLNLLLYISFFKFCMYVCTLFHNFKRQH